MIEFSPTVLPRQLSVLRKISWLLFGPLIANALLLNQVSAQDKAAKPERRYQIDVIVFLHKRRDRLDEEQPAKTVELDASQWLLYEDVAAGKHQDLVPVPEEGRGLSEQWDALTRSSRYQPLIRASWIMPRWDDSKAPTIRLRDGNRFAVTAARFDPEGVDYGFEGGYSFDDFFNADVGAETFNIDQLDGSVRVYIGRFVHFVSDLTLTEPLPDVAPSVTYTVSEEGSTNEASETPVTELTTVDVSTYRLQESRRMKVDEVHYFDHPHFGLIAQVRRYEEIDPVTQPANPGDVVTPPSSKHSAPPS